MREQPGQDFLEVGRVVRPHALAGETVVELVSNRPERLEPGSSLYWEGTELRVRRARPFKKRWIVSFEGVDDVEAAERLRGATLVAEPLEDPDALWVHDLVGSAVTTAAGEHLGTVTSVLANPASDLMELESGALVPVRFVTKYEPGEIVVDVPPGLFD